MAKNVYPLAIKPGDWLGNYTVFSLFWAISCTFFSDLFDV
jgi:choline-glycine betaine transporter